jgi:hypothetical protein
LSPPAKSTVRRSMASRVLLVHRSSVASRKSQRLVDAMHGAIVAGVRPASEEQSTIRSRHTPCAVRRARGHPSRDRQSQCAGTVSRAATAHGARLLLDSIEKWYLVRHVGS